MYKIDRRGGGWGSKNRILRQTQKSFSRKLSETIKPVIFSLTSIILFYFQMSVQIVGLNFHEKPNNRKVMFNYFI